MTTIGIIGGSGMLGRPIANAILRSGAPLWVSNRSGKSEGFEGTPTVTTDNQALVEACDVVLLCVPPAQAGGLNINAQGKLVVSVMAGISLSKIKEITGSQRAVRAMSSPAAQLSLAYSPWCASADVTAQDKAAVTAMFATCGTTDEVTAEAQIELFTAITGPVPGFVAYFADCMSTYATQNGVPAAIADRAIRQLFLGAGTMMANTPETPADQVQEMVDYAGTTAAGLLAMQASPLAEHIHAGLDAAVTKTRSMG